MLLWDTNTIKISEKGRVRMRESWKKLSSEYALNSKWLKVRKDTVELPNGHIMDDYFIIEKKDVALIAALDSENKILLKEEYRYPIDDNLIELPGGTLEDGETDPLISAKRELREETGYVSDEWELLACNYDYPTKEANRVYIFCARNVKKVAEQKLDISENIKYKFVSTEEAVELCRRNEIKVNGTVSGILLVKDRITFRK